MNVTDLTHILHHSQEQAFRPVPQRVNFLVEQAGKPVHKKLIENGATSQLTNLTERRKFGNGLFKGFYGSKEVRQRILQILRILRIEGRRENKYSAIEIACRQTKRAR